MKLYNFGLSGNAYKARLMLGFLGLDYERINVDLASGEQSKDDFLAINPAGQVPVLVDQDNIITDSHGILFYLAKAYGNGSDVEWLPESPVDLARVAVLISQVSDDVNNGLSAARLVKLFGAPLDYEQAKDRALKHLTKLEQSLSGKKFLLGDKPTLADIAMYPYVKTAADGGVDLAPYSNVNEWLKRFEALPRYVDING